MADFLLTGAVSNAVNMPSLTAEEAARLKPYMVLAEQLGSFAGQLTETGIRAVEIEYEGAVADLNVKPLTAIALTGLLAPQLATVNIVNAPLICRRARHPRQRNPPCRRRRLSEPDPADSHDRAAAAFGRRHGFRRQQAAPRRNKGIPLEAELGRHVLFVRNYEKPGFIGALGRALGESRSISRLSTWAAPRPGRMRSRWSRWTSH